MRYVTPALKKYVTLTKNQKYCIQKTIFMMHRRQTVPNYCTKLTLTAMDFECKLESEDCHTQYVSHSKRRI